MKKIYNSPMVDVVELKHHQMLLAGSEVFDIVDDDTINPGSVDAPPGLEVGPNIPGLPSLIFE